MSDAATSYCALSDIADTNVETLPANTSPSALFRYIDLSAVEAGLINWGAVTETTFGTAPSRARRVAKGLDVLFGTVRPNLKSHGFIGPDEPGALIASTGFSVVRGRDGVSHPAYLFHSLMSNHVTAQAVRDAIGSSYPALNDSDVRRLQIFLPSYGEQQRISQVLDTLDTAIHETEAIIAKLKAVKQGLLHDLLTRGIDANGELRPPQAEAPHLYKESPLGWIPNEWEVVPTVTRCTLITKGTTPAAHEMWQGSEGIRFLRVDNLSFDGQFDLNASAFRVSAATHNGSLSRSKCQPGDVLTNIVGPPLGKLGLVTEESGEININQAIALFRPNEMLLPRFLLIWLSSARSQAWLGKRAKQTSGQVNLTLALCQELPLPCLAMTEQQAIVDRVHAAQDRIYLEEDLLEKIRSKKSGLMDDLLTGRVRVTPLLEAAP